MKAADVMTRNVVTVERRAAVAEAIWLMLDNHVSGLPVVEDGNLVGILTEGDLLRRNETGTERHRPRWLEILMGPGRIKRVPVLDGDALIGIISRADLLRALALALEERAVETRTDDEIREQ